MNDAIKNLHTWLEMALEFAEPCCVVHKRTKLKLVFLMDEEEEAVVTWYVECPRCNREYHVNVAFHPIIIPRGNGHKEE